MGILSSPDEIAGDLAEHLRARVKTELEPGERLLWADRAYHRHDRISGAFLAWGFIVVVLAVVSCISWAQFVRNPLGEIGGLLSLGLGLGVVEFFVVLGLVSNWLRRRGERVKRENTLYALTDRRAILWEPVVSSGAVKIVTFPKGCVSGVHRLEYSDGSGDVLFRTRGSGFQYGDEYWGPSGFLGVVNVRRVEEQVRRTLVIPQEAKDDRSV